MKQVLLLTVLLFFSVSAIAQKDTLIAKSYAVSGVKSYSSAESQVNIYPVPVRDGQVTISAEKEIESVKITNIIGQDVYKSSPGEFSSPMKITLDNPKRGVYIVSITFKDRTRCVKKIMVEGADSW